MEYINLTPHAIRVRNKEGDIVTFNPSGQTARVTEIEEVVGSADDFELTRGVQAGNNLPEPKAGTILIVSAIVLSALAGRKDLVAPNTGATAVRNEKGHIDYVLGFRVN